MRAVALSIFGMEYEHMHCYGGWLRRLLVDTAVYVRWGLARLYLSFSMISDYGYGHFCYGVGSAFLWYMGWIFVWHYCCLRMEGQRMGLERGAWRGRLCCLVSGMSSLLCILSSHGDIEMAASECREGVLEDWSRATRASVASFVYDRA